MKEAGGRRGAQRVGGSGAEDGEGVVARDERRNHSTQALVMTLVCPLPFSSRRASLQWLWWMGW